MRQPRAGTIAAAVLAASALCATAADAAAPRQAGSMTYTSTVPGSPTGLELKLDFRNPDDPGAKPHAVRRMVVHGPPGGVIDTTVPPQCHASDAELMAQGASACPPETRIGTAVVVSDLGGVGFPPRYSTTHVSDFNNQGEIIGFGQSDDLPVFRTVDHTKIEGDTSTTELPLVPGAPPPEPFAAFKSFHFKFPPYVRGNRTYNRTPPTCPAAGYWTMKIDLTYIDGVTESVVSRSPCQSSDKRVAKHHKKRHHKKRHHRKKHRGPVEHT
jgi:hypothetical protein